MNSNAQKWVAALRSGEYDQGTDGLQTEGGYCCLGVACDLYMKETGNGEWLPPALWESGDSDEPEANADKFYAFKVNTPSMYEPRTESFILSPVVQGWLGLTTSDGAYKGDSTAKPFSLTTMNDRGESFQAIADTIENYDKELFDNDSEIDWS
jgi:hypothetical protein|tara:strand:- start:752 stop:1210 length:459 start_codon:yes stop_codon:yes gene_type:complete